MARSSSQQVDIMSTTLTDGRLSLSPSTNALDGLDRISHKEPIDHPSPAIESAPFSRKDNEHRVFKESQVPNVSDSHVRAKQPQSREGVQKYPDDQLHVSVPAVNGHYEHLNRSETKENAVGGAGGRMVPISSGKIQERPNNTDEKTSTANMGYIRADFSPWGERPSYRRTTSQESATFTTPPAVELGPPQPKAQQVRSEDGAGTRTICPSAPTSKSYTSLRGDGGRRQHDNLEREVTVQVPTVELNPQKWSALQGNGHNDRVENVNMNVPHRQGEDPKRLSAPVPPRTDTATYGNQPAMSSDVAKTLNRHSVSYTQTSANAGAAGTKFDPSAWGERPSYRRDDRVEHVNMNVALGPQHRGKDIGRGSAPIPPRTDKVTYTAQPAASSDVSKSLKPQPNSYTQGCGNASVNAPRGRWDPSPWEARPSYRREDPKENVGVNALTAKVGTLQLGERGGHSAPAPERKEPTSFNNRPAQSSRDSKGSNVYDPLKRYTQPNQPSLGKSKLFVKPQKTFVGPYMNGGTGRETLQPPPSSSSSSSSTSSYHSAPQSSSTTSSTSSYSSTTHRQQSPPFGGLHKPSSPYWNKTSSVLPPRQPQSHPFGPVSDSQRTGHDPTKPNYSSTAYQTYRNPPPPHSSQSYNNYQRPTNSNSNSYQPYAGTNNTYQQYGQSTYGSSSSVNRFDESCTLMTTQKDLRELLESIPTDEDVEVLAQPEGLTVNLLRHQLKGLAWLKDRENGINKGGMLADDMGLGKTLQSISLILTNPSEDKKCKTTLVVAPLALIRQWEDEIETKTKKGLLRVLVYHGSSRTKDPAVLARYDVVITTYQVVASEFPKTSKKKKDAEDSPPKAKSTLGPLYKAKFYRIILDEAQTIKNKSTRSALGCYELEAEKRICLTGTPLQNNVDELYSLLKFLKIKPYHDYAIFKDQISNPLARGRSKVAYNRLQLILGAIMLRRTKTTLIDGKPLLSLPSRNVKVEKVKFTAREQAFYDRLETTIRTRFKTMIKSGKAINYTNVLVLLMRLRQACNHYRLVPLSETLDDDSHDTNALKGVDNALDDDVDDDDDMDLLAKSLGDMSVKSGKQRQCAICRDALKADVSGDLCADCAVIKDDDGDSEGKGKATSAMPEQSTKIRVMMSRLEDIDEKSPDSKIIIFSQFTSMLDLVEVSLKEKGFRFSRYDGSMSNTVREANLNAFRTDSKIQIMLISLKCDQAIDRVHRIGQTRPVYVTQITIEGTVEDRILELQKKKRELIEGALGNAEFQQKKKKKLSTEELIYLFMG
ncbi:hypothetical protein HK102_000513 [Quaeritorhiza haematococci]|nr:hypothetical protein HK102_000513 [Quaeritorhiza haematococci]